MAEAGVQPFRFLDLPRELRDEIYNISLCYFEPASEIPIHVEGLPDWLQDEVPKYHELRRAENTIDTTINILRTCKQLHSEAYHIMFKNNQLISIEATGLPLYLMLIRTQIPVITMDEERIDEHHVCAASLQLHYDSSIFRTFYAGYSISELENLETADPFAHALATGKYSNSKALILGRDWPLVCKMLDIKLRHFASSVKLTLSLLPSQNSVQKIQRRSVGQSLAEKIESLVLEPFRHVRGFQWIYINGISATVANSLVEELSQPVCCEPIDVITALQDISNEGRKDFLNGDLEASIRTYSLGTHWLRSLRYGTSWSVLVQKGGARFLDLFADVWFWLDFRCSHATMRLMAVPRFARHLRDMAISVSNDLNEALDIDYNLDEMGVTWQPTNLQIGHTHLGLGKCYRLGHQPTLENIKRAVEHVEMASAMLPNYPSVCLEKAQIMRWIRNTSRRV